MSWEWQFWGKAVYSGYSSSAQAIMVRIQGPEAAAHTVFTLSSHHECTELFTCHFLSMGAAKHQCQAQWAGLLTWVITIKVIPHKHVRPSPKWCHGLPSWQSPSWHHTCPSLSESQTAPWFSPFYTSHSGVLYSHFFHPWETPAYLSMETSRNSYKGLGWAHSLQELSKVSLLWQT